MAAVRARAKAYHISGLHEGASIALVPSGCIEQDKPSSNRSAIEAGVAACIRAHGVASLLARDAKACRQGVLESLTLCRGCGDAQGAAWCLMLLGRAALFLGELDEAGGSPDRSRGRFERLESPFGACH